MNILQVNLVLILFYALFFLCIKSKTTRIIFLIFTTIQFAILPGFRGVTVGVDTWRYERSFNWLKEINNFNDFLLYDSDFGFKLVQRIILFFTDNFNYMLIVFSLFIFISLGIFIYRYSKSIFLSYILFICLGFFDHSFNLQRQIIALSIVLFSYSFILKKKPKHFFMVVLCASLFHSSAIVFLPAYYFAHMKWKKHTVILIPSIFMLFFIFKNQIGEIFTILYYDEATKMLNSYTSTSGLGGMALLILIILIIGFVIYNPLRHNDIENKVLFNLLVISFFIQTISSFSYLFTRLNLFYFIFIILYIPNVIYNLDKSKVNIKRRYLKVAQFTAKSAVAIIVITYYLTQIKIDGADIIPYYFFWE
ncbi:EpsG family protein [Sutcliffiella deserti]|uniref:EpsG family protein n=1 Tax=Sutcliffiella deserti TaxID=2875501 RepID=UPI001CBE9131